METTKKIPNYKRRSKVAKVSGMATIAATTGGGFFGYQAYTNFDQFTETIKNFVVVQEEGMKLNPLLALPLLMSIIVFLFVIRKKNKDFFKDKASLGLLIAIFVTYFFYSIAQSLLFALIGALVGVMADEFGFSTLVTKNEELAKKEVIKNDEYELETIRLSARRQAKLDEENRIKEMKVEIDGGV